MDLLTTIYRRAVAAVNPQNLIQEDHLPAEGPVRVLAVGKAAGAMARRACRLLGGRVSAGLVVTKDGHDEGGHGLPSLEAAHPVPDRRSLEAGARALDLPGQGTTLVLLSGGASALLEHLPEGMTLQDLMAMNRELLGSGAPIQEVNTVRKHLSRIKGGWLAQRLGPCHTLALSDVLGSDPASIGSGPTVPDPTTLEQAREIAHRRNAEKTEQLLERFGSETPKQLPEARYELLADNRMLAEAALREAPVPATLLTTYLEGEAREVGQVLASIAREIRRHGDTPHLLVASGETTVTLRGPGRGGRCQELALSFALHAKDLEEVYILAAGSDGTDGPTPAAGAVLRADQCPAEAAEALRDNDAYSALRNFLLVTGPTGTNVNDLILVLVP